jgi:hypothetical protein
MKLTTVDGSVPDAHPWPATVRGTVVAFSIETDFCHLRDGEQTVSEVEFVNETSAMSASGQFGKSRLWAGIVGHADLRLGKRRRRVINLPSAKAALDPT